MAESSTLAKGLNILALFDKDHSVINIPEIATLSNLPESTAYRYIATLKSQGLIVGDTRPGYYRLGLKILELAQVAREQLSIIDIALPVMQRLLKKTEETIVLTAIRGQRVICIERVESNHTLRLSFGPGLTMFMHAGASAKIVMAYLDEEDQDKIIREEGLPKFTENTITDPVRLRAELKDIRKKGFAISTGELDPGARAIAAPIFDKVGKIISGLSIAGPVDRIKGSKVKEFTQLVTEAADEIAKRINKTGWIL